MIGKTLGVVEYNLTFGTDTRKVNVFSCFRYIKNNNLYVIYADVATKHELLHYGSSHVKNNTILSMACKIEEIEIIKEYIYKVINNQDLSDFQTIDLKDINGIEIIGSNNLEIKLEVIKKLEELTIPVLTTPIEEKPKKEQSNKQINKKNSKKLLFILLIIIIFLGGGYFYLTTSMSNNVSKQIVCTKVSTIKEIKATLSEQNTYNFKKNNQLNSIETINTYQFDNEIDYQNFNLKGTYHKYINKSEEPPIWNNETYTFKVTYGEEITSSYTKPTDYEEVIKYYNTKGYSCTEK